MAKKLKSLKKLKKSYGVGKKIAGRVIEPKITPFSAYDARRILSKFIAYSKKRKPIKKIKRPTVKPKIIKDAKRKPAYPSGKRVYATVKKTRPYELRLPSKHLTPPYSLAKLYPHAIGPKDPRGIRGKRVYKYIGKYPNPLGITQIFSLKLSKWGHAKLFRLAKGVGGIASRMESYRREDKIHLINFIVNKLKEVYYDMKEFGDKIIDIKIPLRSGTMRKKMKRSLERKHPNILPRPAKIEMKMFLHADVPYAGVVTGMDRYGSPHVAHAKSIYSKYPTAEDPDAVKKGYYVVLRDLKFYFRKLFRGMLYEIYVEMVRIRMKTPSGITAKREKKEVQNLAKQDLIRFFDVEVYKGKPKWHLEGLPF